MTLRDIFQSIEGFLGDKMIYIFVTGKALHAARKKNRSRHGVFWSGFRQLGQMQFVCLILATRVEKLMPPSC